MKKIFSILTFKEFTVTYLGILLTKLQKKIGFTNYYYPLYKLINLYSDRGYQLNTCKDGLIIYGQAPFSDYKFIIRPNTSDQVVFDQVITNKEYYPIINIIIALNKQKAIHTIIDAGANIGCASLFFKTYFTNSKIICIEPDCSNAYQLKKNILLNKLQNEAEIINKALWSNSNEKLCVSDHFRDGKSWSKSISTCTQISGNIKNEVKGITLKEIIEQYQLENIAILKIDIEGGEKELFSDNMFLETIKQHVLFLAMEIHDETNMRNTIHNKLTGANFEIKKMGETLFAYNKTLVNS